ncbi:SDR family NAD(P)-dependent oxidoreductase, partial [Frankia sp. Cppng1_Ct_nod]|uniref:SDR family NAD(P)-dependent oxidoreductase n=1 Tax=Frankia sp. Cppng1_Ct_nod TaxID=2897162 RepID=UPI0020254640
MAGTLAGRKALITGAGQGIGRGIALAFAEQGAAVTLVGRTESKLIEVAKEIRDLG